MAEELTYLVAQQLADTRPSPTLEVQQQLGLAVSTSPTEPSSALDPKTTTPRLSTLTRPVNSNPTSPTTPTTATATYKDGSAPTTPVVPASAHLERAAESGQRSPQGADDIFSLASDKQLAAKYTFIKEIGFGNWGSVWKVKKNQWPGETQAVKLVFRIKEDKTTPARVRSVWQEFKVIRAFKKDPHPNIIHFHHFIITPSYALVTMDIHEKLMPINVPEVEARAYFSQLLSAVDFLHIRGVTHNDIKPANILLSSGDRPVIVDFGFANRWSLAKEHKDHAFCSSLSWGTPEYLSPERAMQKLHDERLSDIWALGVTMYEIVVGRTPFEKTENEEFLTKEALEVYYKRTLNGQFLGVYKLSLALEDLIRQMVEPSIALRLPTCRKGLDHPFFSPRPPSVMADLSVNPLQSFSTSTGKGLVVPFDLTLKAEEKAAKPAITSKTGITTSVQASDPAADAVALAPPAATPNIPRKPLIPRPVSATPANTPNTVSKTAGTSLKVGATGKQIRATGVSVSTSPNKKRRDNQIKIYQDVQSKPTANPPARPTGLKPLLLRAESSQTVKSGKDAIPGTPNSPKIASPLAPAMVFGVNSVVNVNNATIPDRTSMKSFTTSTPKKSAANVNPKPVRDSKELRSPSSIKTFKAGDSDKENAARDSPLRRPAVEPVKRTETKSTSPKKATNAYAEVSIETCEPTNEASVHFRTLVSSVARGVMESARRPDQAGTVARASPTRFTRTESENIDAKPAKLSKRQPATIKPQKSISALSFTSLSSSLKASVGRFSEEKNRPVFGTDDEYAIVDRNGRTSGDLLGMTSYTESEVLHIKNLDTGKIEILQERIISPEAQRKHGQAVTEEQKEQKDKRFDRIFMSRSNGIRSNKQLPEVPPIPAPPATPASSPSNIIRRSLAPSFASKPSLASTERCESRQSEFSAASSMLDSVTEHSDAESLRSSELAHSSSVFVASRALAPSRQELVPAITVSRPFSIQQARSCWSPETCRSDNGNADKESIQESSQQTWQEERGDEGENTIHATPPFRRDSAVYARAPNADSIYQSFICPSPNVDVSRSEPVPRSTSLSSTWGPSTRALQNPTPEPLANYKNMSKLNTFQSAYTLFPPPDDLRSLASPPPRPDSSTSRKTISKVKSFFGRLGFGHRQ